MLPIPHDYHLHTEFSIDSDTPMEDQCRRAIELGIPEICITEHADFVHIDEGVNYYDPVGFMHEIERCRELFEDQLRLKAGVEIGEWHRFPGQAATLADQHPYDFIIGSLHWVDDQLVLDPSYFTGRDERDAYERYFSELLLMVQHGGFDVIGHLDCPKRAGFDVYGGFHTEQFEGSMREVLRAAIERGIGIELNTGTARRRIGRFSPELEVLRWYREMGGEIITVGSDAHTTKSLGYRFDDAREMLDAAGFTAVTCFDLRQPYFEDLDDE